MAHILRSEHLGIHHAGDQIHRTCVMLEYVILVQVWPDRFETADLSKLQRDVSLIKTDIFEITEVIQHTLL